MGVDSGAHRRAAKGHFLQLAHRAVEATNAALHLAGVALELLPQADWRGVLQVGASGFDDRHELFGLVAQRVLQPVEGRLQLLLDRHQCRQVNGCRDDVIAGLAHVDVVVLVHRAGVTTLAAEQLVGA